VLPGNQNAADIREKSLRKKAAQPQLEIARQRAVAALDANRPAEARAALASMRALDAEHPAVALLEGKLQAPAAREVGESTNPGLSLDDPAPPPIMRAPQPASSGMGMDAGGLGDLSLDSLTLDEPPGTVVPPPPGMGDPITGPLRLGGQALGGDSFGMDSSADLSLDLGSNQTFDHGGSTGAPPDLWSTPEPDAGGAGAGGYDASSSMFTSAADTSYSDTQSYSTPEPAAPSTDDEIATLLQQGDDAARSGNRQQAIEIWSRIFLIDINNSDAVGRIEKARQEMAEGNRRAADSLKQGREKFEAGDFTAAREAFLQVLAIDETDQTARSYLDRIEQQLSRPSSGLDLSRRTHAGDVLEEEMAEAAAEPLDAAPIPARSEASKPQKAPRAPMDKRFLMALGVAAVLAVVVGVYLLWLRPSSGAAAGGAPQPVAGAAGARRSSTRPRSSATARSPRRSPS
jgi:tetratricopeptide (TPR) repeat protein